MSRVTNQIYQQVNTECPEAVHILTRVIPAERPENTGLSRVTRVTFRLSQDLYTRVRDVRVRMHMRVFYTIFSDSIKNYSGYPGSNNNNNTLQTTLPWISSGHFLDIMA